MTDQKPGNAPPAKTLRPGLRRPDAAARGEITRLPASDDEKTADAPREDAALGKLADDPAALRAQVLGEAGQRSGSRLDPDRGYAAGHAARDARADGSALDEDATGAKPSSGD